MDEVVHSTESREPANSVEKKSAAGDVSCSLEGTWPIWHTALATLKVGHP